MRTRGEDKGEDKKRGRVGGDGITCDRLAQRESVRARGLALWVTESDSKLNGQCTLTLVARKIHGAKIRKSGK
jgi:hypothetical protein